MVLTAPQEVAVVTAANSAEAAMPKRVSLPSMLPPACSALASLVDALLRNQRVAKLLAVERENRQRHEQDQHRGQDHPALAGIADHCAEGVGESERNQENRQHLQQIRQGRWDSRTDARNSR